MRLTDGLLGLLAPGRPWRWVLAGLAAGLAAGWLGWSRLSAVTVTQPLRFSHSVHARQDVGCASCHFTGPGKTFSGLPSIAVCAGCHPEPTGGRSEDEKEIDKLVTGYVKKGRDVPWLVLAGQPDHVFFVHGPHLRYECSRCHPDMSREDYPAFRRNRISGQSGTAMSMKQCRSCHAAEKASQDCVSCHR